MNNNIESIKYLVCFPRNKQKWYYYINSNLEKKYFLKVEELNTFINSLVDTSITEQLYNNLNESQPFLIDVENNKIKEITIDTNKLSKQEKNAFWKINSNGERIFQTLKNTEQKTKISQYEIPNIVDNENLVNKLV